MDMGLFTSSISFGDILLWLVVLLLFFIIIREFVTWYWKLTKISKSLEQIESLLRKHWGIREEIEVEIESKGGFPTPKKN